MLIIGGSGSGKTNALLNLTEEEDSDFLTTIDKIYLYANDLNEPKYQLLIKKREDAGIKHLNDSKSIYRVFKYYGCFAIILMITIQKEDEKS